MTISTFFPLHPHDDDKTLDKTYTSSVITEGRASARMLPGYCVTAKEKRQVTTTEPVRVFFFEAKETRVEYDNSLLKLVVLNNLTKAIS